MSPEQNIFLEQLFRNYAQRLVLYAMSALEDRAGAEDVVQDAFYTGATHIDDLLAHENPGGWLMETVKNKIREHRRAQRRYVKHFLSLDSDIPAELVPAPSQDLLRSDRVLIIEKIRQTLTPEEMHHLERLVFESASHTEIAEELGITVWTSQKRLERIRKKLRENFLNNF